MALDVMVLKCAVWVSQKMPKVCVNGEIYGNSDEANFRKFFKNFFEKICFRNLTGTKDCFEYVKCGYLDAEIRGLSNGNKFR